MASGNRKVSVTTESDDIEVIEVEVPVRRKVVREVELVTFESDLFEGKFVFPTLEHVPIGVMVEAAEGRLGSMLGWLRELRTPKDQVDAFASLSVDELEGFISAWGGASAVDAPKSGG